MYYLNLAGVVFLRLFMDILGLFSHEWNVEIDGKLLWMKLNVYFQNPSQARMKCSGKKEDGTPCDYTAEETFAFCPNCGSSCIAEESEPPVDVITCPGKNKQCGAQISSDSKANFCKECGWRIDQSLFCTPSKKCPGKNDDGSLCGGNITENDKFCLNCGQDFTSGNLVL